MSLHFLPISLLTITLLSACSSQEKASERVQVCLDKLSNSQLVKKQAITTSCIVTAGLWKAIGQDNPASLICLAGGGAGFLIGSSIAERKCHYRIAEEQLDGEISHAKKVNFGFNMLFLQKSEQIMLQTMTVESLKAQHKEGQASLVYLKSVKEDTAKITKKERQLVNTLKKEVAFKNATLNKSKQLNKKEKIKSLRKEIILLNKNINLLRKENQKLYRLENQLAGLQ
jgi:hypothetical protein